MKLTSRIEVLIQLGIYLNRKDETLNAVIHQTFINNGWFTKENIKLAINAIAENFLNKEKLEKWLAQYDIPEDCTPQTIALILAGNIPLVGFHDLLCVFLSGNKSLIKVSEKDKYLIPHFIKVMEEIDDETKNYFEVSERLQDFDGVIATGSNNSARYFEAYFGKHPNIIRKNRNAVAIFRGNETAEQLKSFGQDVFQYFGLGCRNVSKLYLPKDYQFNPLLEALYEYKEIVLHHKYKNNFDYGYTLLILNKVPYQANGCIMLLEETSLTSRIAQLHYEYYEDEADLKQKLDEKHNEIQCIVGNDFEQISTIPFGEAQNPGLNDYADGVDTMEFLLSL